MYVMDSNKKMALNLKLAMYVKVEFQLQKFDVNDYAVLAVYPACFYGASKEHPYEVCLARFVTEEQAQAYLEDIVANSNFLNG